MAKTPKAVVEQIERHRDIIDHVDEVLRVKRTVPVENQATHVREKSEAYYIGLADGANAMLENVLHSHKCYAGFMHLSPKIFDGGLPRWEGVSSKHPDFADWRRMYYVKP